MGRLTQRTRLCGAEEAEDSAPRLVAHLAHATEDGLVHLSLFALRAYKWMTSGRERYVHIPTRVISLVQYTMESESSCSRKPKNHAHAKDARALRYR